MKICPNCGAENKTDAKFCIKCGALLDDSAPHTREEAKQIHKQSKQKEPKKKSNKWLITILVIIILILLFVIGCALGKSTDNSSSDSSAKNSPVKQSSALTQQQKQDIQSQQQSKTDNSNNLSVKELTPQQTATAIAFYEKGHPNNSMSSAAWGVVKGVNSQVSINDNDNEKISNKGAGVSYGYNAQMGGYTEYTLSDNGQTVNMYEVPDDPYSDSDEIKNPVQSVALQDIVDYINQQKAAQTVRNVAEGVKIVDNRKQKLDTKNLTKQQLKDWALQTFKNTYSDSASDDLSAECLGIDSDGDAEVTVHDNDNSGMDTTYRVNSDGVLQEQDGSDWTTVSTGFSE